ncbi:MAG TPA: LysM peptidoglycan-binding domain-containing protein [Bacillota bacterium]|nr:LysM peptidoglycan-binding domain-containing protein [Bacillota bacterium]
MDIYLIDPAGPQLHLPVNPGEVTIRREKAIETVNIINIGEVDFPIGERVKEIAFSSFFPAEYDPSYCRYADLPDPQEAMNQLTAWMMKRGPVRLIITDTIVNVLVLVSVHQSIFRGGEPGDVYFDLTCRTWREVKVRTAREATAPVDSGGVAVEPRPDLKPVPKIYEVKPGDSLWAIAKLNFGDGSKWSDIYALNRDRIGPDPNLIATGLQLVMPA